jgi:small subunit ribosomal protein S1
MTDDTSAASPDKAAVKPSNEASAGDPATGVSSAGVPSGQDADAAATQPPVSSAPTEGPAGLAAEAGDTDTAPSGPANADLPEAATEGKETADSSGQRKKIQIGSRRDEAKTPMPSKPMLAKPRVKPGEEQQSAEDEPSVVEKVPAPTKRTPLPPELEQAVDEAMAEVSIDDLMNAVSTSQADQEIELESRRLGQVVRIHGENIFFSVGGRNEGVASVRQFKEPPTVGDEMDVVVKRFMAEDGLYELGMPGATVSVSDWSDVTEGAVVEARITGANTGGLECMVNQLRGFIPSSQIALFRVQDFGEFIGQKLACVVMEVNPKRRNLVISHRALLEREKEEARAKLLEELEVGLIVEGVVRNVRDFGAFVDIGGLDGLIHISQLSWERVNHPSDVVTEGQKVQVRVEKINPETGKIGLSYRDLLEHPWSKVDEELTVGSTVRGPVTRVAKFGAFVRLAAGVEGLIHISELAHHRVRAVSDVVSEAQEVDVKILSIDTESQRIALSLKATLPEPEAPPEEAANELPAALVKKSSKPLKGGFDRPTGGEDFGLKW